MAGVSANNAVAQRMHQRLWILALIAYTAGSASLWWYVDDDAAITFAYVRNLVEGHGLV
jgi:hypothetical protein